MTTIFGRNADIASGPEGDLPVEPARFYTVADDKGDLAVYDSHIGVYAPLYGDTARFLAADLNAGLDYIDRYQWKDSL